MTSEYTETDPLAGIRIIDTDAHFTEPEDLWSSRVPAALKDKVPAHQTVDGQTAWYLDGKLWASTGGNTIAKGREKVLGTHRVQPFSAMDKAAWDVKERLELLDDAGIWGQVLYPNGMGFSSNHIFAIDDPELRTVVLQTYNDFYVDIQEESKGRLFPQALLPIWDMDLTIKEMTRLLDKGIKGFTLSDKPEMIGLPELPEPYFEPMWDLFNESGAVPNFHIGSGNRREDIEAYRAAAVQKAYDPAKAAAESAGKIPDRAAPAWRTFGPQRRLAVEATQMYISNVRIIVNLCMSQMFDRYPKLKIVSAESGIGWVPFILESMEFQFDQMVSRPEEIGFTQRRPIEYFREHIYTMFWFERTGPEKLVADIGEDRILVETDIPHPTCLYPGAREHFASVLSGLQPGVRRKILQDNAAELYGIELPTQL